jgi:hypothetical protein
MQVGDLVTYDKPDTRAEFDAIGLVLEIQEDWMRNWSKVKVQWHGQEAPKWTTLGSLKLLTPS